MNRQPTLWALISFALIQWLSLSMFGKALAAEPAWWTQKKQECGQSSDLAYNDWVAQGSPCKSGAATATPGNSGSLMTESTKNVVQGIMNNNAQQADIGLAGIGVGMILQGLQSDPAEEARQAQAAEQQRRADEQRATELRRAQQRAQEEALRQQELRKQRILGELKDSEPSTELGLKLGDSHPPLMVKVSEGAFRSSAVVPVGHDSPSKEGLQLKLGDDADGSSAQAGQGFDTDGKILEGKLPGPPPTPTSSSITPAEKTHMLDVLNSSLKKNQAEQKSLKDQLATLQQAPSPDPVAVNKVQDQLAATAAANQDLNQKITKTEKISVSVDLGDATTSQTSAK